MTWPRGQHTEIAAFPAQSVVIVTEQHKSQTCGNAANDHGASTQETECTESVVSQEIRQNQPFQRCTRPSKKHATYIYAIVAVDMFSLRCSASEESWQQNDSVCAQVILFDDGFFRALLLLEVVRVTLAKDLAIPETVNQGIARLASNGAK